VNEECTSHNQQKTLLPGAGGRKKKGGVPFGRVRLAVFLFAFQKRGEIATRGRPPPRKKGEARGSIFSLSTPFPLGREKRKRTEGVERATR